MDFELYMTKIMGMPPENFKKLTDAGVRDFYSLWEYYYSRKSNKGIAMTRAIADISKNVPTLPCTDIESNWIMYWIRITPEHNKKIVRRIINTFLHVTEEAIYCDTMISLYKFFVAAMSQRYSTIPLYEDSIECILAGMDIQRKHDVASAFRLLGYTTYADIKDLDKRGISGIDTPISKYEACHMPMGVKFNQDDYSQYKRSKQFIADRLNRIMFILSHGSNKSDIQKIHERLLKAKLQLILDLCDSFAVDSFMKANEIANGNLLGDVDFSSVKRIDIVINPSNGTILMGFFGEHEPEYKKLHPILSIRIEKLPNSQYANITTVREMVGLKSAALDDGTLYVKLGGEFPIILKLSDDCYTRMYHIPNIMFDKEVSNEQLKNLLGASEKTTLGSIVKLRTECSTQHGNVCCILDEAGEVSYIGAIGNYTKQPYETCIPIEKDYALIYDVDEYESPTKATFKIACILQKEVNAVIM